MRSHNLSLALWIGLCALTISTPAMGQYYGMNPYAMRNAYSGANPYSNGGGNPYAASQLPGGIYNPSFYTPLNFSYTHYQNYSYTNPVTGIPYNFNYAISSSSYGPYIPGVTYRNNAVAGYNANSYTNQYQGSIGAPERNPIVAQRLRVMNRARPGLDPNPKKPEAGIKQRPVQAVAGGQPGQAVDPADEKTLVEAELLNPTAEALTSGLALNQLAQAIHKLQTEHPKVSGPFVPAGVLEDIRFQGSDAALALMLYSQQGKTMSEPFLEKENNVAREALQEPITEFKKAFASEKRVPEKTIGNLRQGIAQARNAIDRSKSPNVESMRNYLDQFDKLAQFARTDESRNAYSGKWFTIGASVDDMVTHMDQYKIKFAAGSESNANEYRLLYRAMINYYAKLKRIG